MLHGSSKRSGCAWQRSTTRRGPLRGGAREASKTKSWLQVTCHFLRVVSGQKPKRLAQLGWGPCQEMASFFVRPEDFKDGNGSPHVNPQTGFAQIRASNELHGSPNSQWDLCTPPTMPNSATAMLAPGIFFICNLMPRTCCQTVAFV